MKIILAIIVISSCLFSAVLGKFMIPFLLRLKVGQTVRNDGPESHLKKNGTPTMGGVIFLISYTVLCLIFAYRSPYVLPILLLTLGFGVIGFADDFIKVVLKRSMGLKPWQKTIGQLVVSSLFAWYMVSFSGLSLALRIPFTEGRFWHIGFLAIPLIYLVLLGTTNGTNFTDGLDGLASSVTVVVAMFFMITAAILNKEFMNGMISAVLVPGKVFVNSDVSVAVMITSAAMIGSLLGFLFYNAHPASVFMGDTGSLALGGYVAATAYMMQMPLFIIIVGFIYLFEVISVILQVGYFKISHGKRIFKMAPIHHHFEKCGYSEVKVVAGFVITTILLCFFGILAL